MATSEMCEVIQHLRRTVLLRDGVGLTDGQLLEDYISRRDEAAFAALVRRHGPMVYGVRYDVARVNRKKLRGLAQADKMPKVVNRRFFAERNGKPLLARLPCGGPQLTSQAADGGRFLSPPSLPYKET